MSFYKDVRPQQETIERIASEINSGQGKVIPKGVILDFKRDLADTQNKLRIMQSQIHLATSLAPEVDIHWRDTKDSIHGSHIHHTCPKHQTQAPTIQRKKDPRAYMTAFCIGKGKLASTTENGMPTTANSSLRIWQEFSYAIALSKVALGVKATRGYLKLHSGFPYN